MSDEEITTGQDLDLSESEVVEDQADSGDFSPSESDSDLGVDFLHDVL